MYQYEYDKETGGIVLNAAQATFSKEPRPVYASELDLLGFDKYWKYEKNDSLPYMWAEANRYLYRGDLIGQTNGGDVFTAPKLEIKQDKLKLKPIDISVMIDKNRDIMLGLEQDTLQKIYTVWKKHKDKLDVFHVAFSGGKDSLVLLDLVKNALPKDAFVVVFGDTGMEFPDTYEAINQVKEQCEAEGIRFLTAKSHLTPHKSWRMLT